MQGTYCRGDLGTNPEELRGPARDMKIMKTNNLGTYPLEDSSKGVLCKLLMSGLIVAGGEEAKF